MSPTVHDLSEIGGARAPTHALVGLEARARQILHAARSMEVAELSSKDRADHFALCDVFESRWQYALTPERANAIADALLDSSGHDLKATMQRWARKHGWLRSRKDKNVRVWELAI